MTLLLGVDGGATKTIALIADSSGAVVGVGRNGSSDIHAESDPGVAIDRVSSAVHEAARAAGIPTERLDAAVFSLCGADWPEDETLYAAELRSRLGLGFAPRIVNDAMGALRAGTAEGIGVALVLGTGGAIGARGPGGLTWFSGMRLEPSGAVELGRIVYHRLIRAAYSDGAVPAFQEAALQAIGVESVEALVHALTARGGLGDAGLARLAAVLLEAEHEGDPGARTAVSEHARMLAGYLRGAARRVGLPERGATLVAAGGVLRHHCPDLIDAVARELPEFHLVRAEAEPVHGALLLAADTAGIQIDPVALRATGPAADYFETR